MPEKIKNPKESTYPIESENINKYGISSGKLYDIISENPQSFVSYYNALIENREEEENTPEIREFLSNINRRFGKNFGFVYDPLTKGGLHPIKEDDPRYKEIMNYSFNYGKPETKTQNINQPPVYSGTKPTPRHYYGGGSYGVGGEDLPEYNWWKQDQNIQDLKKKYPTHAEFFDNNPPRIQQQNKLNQPTKRLESVKNEYDPSDREVTENGVYFKNPSLRFYKNYDNGSREEISQSEYEKMLPYNTLPSHVKDLYVE